MEQAQYGRMRVGRCLVRDYYVGCTADVLVQMDSKCSGKRHCHVPVPDQDLLTALSCPKDLVAYLEAEYSCVQVEQPPHSLCSAAILVQLTGQKPQAYVSSEVTQQTGAGTARCPWVIQAERGQQIKVYLIDLSEGGDQLEAMAQLQSQHQHAMGMIRAAYLRAEQNNTSHRGGALFSGEFNSLGAAMGRGRCRLYATVREQYGGGSSEAIVCSSRSRNSVVMTSRGHVINVVMHVTRDRHVTNWSKFILKFEARGCADPILPTTTTTSHFSTPLPLLESPSPNPLNNPDQSPHEAGGASPGIHTPETSLPRGASTPDSTPGEGVAVGHGLMYLVRRGDQVDIMCNGSSQSWHLVCKATRWVGEFGNCTGRAGSYGGDQEQEAVSWTVTYGLWFAVSTGLALGMVVGLTLLLILYLKRQSCLSPTDSLNVAHHKTHTCPPPKPILPYPDSLPSNGSNVIDCASRRACALTYPCQMDQSEEGCDQVHVHRLYDTDLYQPMAC